jgi:hypothetical protein
MTELEGQAQSQLIAIEQIYGIRIENRDHIARLIGEKAGDRRQVLTICTALNSWVATNGRKTLAIPHEVLEPLFFLIEWQSKNV